VAASNGGARDGGKPSRRGSLQFGFKVLFLHVAARFGKQHGTSRLQRARDFGEESLRIGEFVHHCEGQGEICLSRKVVDCHALGGSDTGVDAIHQVHLGGTAFKDSDHFRLRIDGNNAGPEAPTNLAMGMVKNPMPGPGSSTLMPSRT
jgi:hypothetical protein